MTSFAGDDVVDFTPQTFALALVHALRRDKRTTHKPSLRMTIAVPRFLMARYCRIRRLTPADYLDAARESARLQQVTMARAARAASKAAALATAATPAPTRALGDVQPSLNRCAQRQVLVQRVARLQRLAGLHELLQVVHRLAQLVQAGQRPDAPHGREKRAGHQGRSTISSARTIASIGPVPPDTSCWKSRAT